MSAYSLSKGFFERVAAPILKAFYSISERAAAPRSELNSVTIIGVASSLLVFIFKKAAAVGFTTLRVKCAGRFALEECNLRLYYVLSLPVPTASKIAYPAPINIINIIYIPPNTPSSHM